MFKKALDTEALILYTKSIAFAVEGSEELALAYANRSAVMFRMGKYTPCLLDINRALREKYPDNLRKKLRDRKKQCLIHIQRLNEIQVEGDETDPIIITNPTEDAEWRIKCNFSNPLIPNASSKIKLECDEKWGRYVVATEDIEAGMFSVSRYCVHFDR